MAKKVLALSVAIFVMIICLSSGCMYYPDKGPISIIETSYWISENQNHFFYYRSSNMKLDKLCVYNGYCQSHNIFFKVRYSLSWYKYSPEMCLMKNISITYNDILDEEYSRDNWDTCGMLMNEYKWDDKFKAIVEEMDGYSEGDEIWFYRVSEEEYINFCVERGLNPFPFELLAI